MEQKKKKKILIEANVDSSIYEDIRKANPESFDKKPELRRAANELELAREINMFNEIRTYEGSNILEKIDNALADWDTYAWEEDITPTKITVKPSRYKLRHRHYINTDIL